MVVTSFYKIFVCYSDSKLNLTVWKSGVQAGFIYNPPIESSAPTMNSEKLEESDKKKKN